MAVVPAGTVLHVLAGPRLSDGLAWVQVATLDNGTLPVRGWLALTDPNGIRLAIPTATAIRLAQPFGDSWPITQGWGSWPAFYAQFTYDGVPLKGHNGLDFGTPQNYNIVGG
ncbi:MAG: hypothetical protein R2867_01920 [Caldilineaceae bacterium]